MSHIALLTTGGTIGSSRDEDGISRPGSVGFDLPGEVRVRTLMSKDSSAFDFADLDRIVDAVFDELDDPACLGVVVLHGTDTMEESSLLVDLFHGDPRPVVFTGAQRTSDHADADGPGNVAAAVDAVLDEANRGRGVLVVFGGRTLPARGLSKWHTTELDAFVSSGEPRDVVPRTPISGVRVDIVALYPGADAVAIDAFVSAGAQGIVLEATGSGNTNPSVVAAVKSAGVPVVVTTRVPVGTIEPTYGGGGGGADLVDAGAVFSPLLRAGQARVVLAVQIATAPTRPRS
ncbi:L-asparaginase [Rhodococcus sp. RS1C4]|uniref:asparaginase n=1 Tax=Nocardiaceae TaxID=85025 RepID=UPI00037B8051|nr:MULTISPECIES: asparaginase [Rhodococcus]OZC48289.1 L-asparaginase [Rhodococcus sp. 06-621-2]OZC51748.1 L-asparaginase [Rhodococcus sp. RS1C4]OZC86852.1 L-asparaginase [Rhodococcus sp. 06-418-1B]OZD15291.1 L-asparaginase [Rhodococcus sp. 06-156-4C]OZD19621.1 L-asparaginase [Rhodococcus sp. 06-156-4a]